MTSPFHPEEYEKIDGPASAENIEANIQEKENDLAELDRKLDYALMKLLLSGKEKKN